jgi:hypothetical protein
MSMAVHLKWAGATFLPFVLSFPPFMLFVAFVVLIMYRDNETSGFTNQGRSSDGNCQYPVSDQLNLLGFAVINHRSYRLNWQGFMACQDLLDEAASFSEPPANFGFCDQMYGFSLDPTQHRRI